MLISSSTGLDCIDSFRKASGPNACEVKPHSKPWIARVYVGGGYCGGTLISSSHILTAAHCIDYCLRLTPEPSKRMTAILGDHDTRKNDTGEITVGIKDLKCHPKFVPGYGNLQNFRNFCIIIGNTKINDDG